MDNEQKKKNSDAKIRANAKYNKKNYKNLSIKIRPDQAEKIRDTAQRHHLSLAQLIVKAVTEYDTNHSDTTTENRTDTADTVTASDTEENTTSNGETETETETETDFDWIDDLYKKNKQSEKK